MANCYIVGCEETLEAVVIDPGDEADKILLALAESSLTVKYIINTHGHFDHISANKKLHEATGAPILAHPLEAPMLSKIEEEAGKWGLPAENSPPPDRLIDDGDTIEFGKITMSVIHTPGHSQGGISLSTDGHVFVGDTLFAGSIGRTDLPGGNFETLKASIQNKLFGLGDDVKVYTGHGPATTIGHEKQTNPFVGQGASFMG